MSYDYQNERPALFTESGVEILLQVRKRVAKKLAVAGAVRFDRATDGITGDSWTMLAAMDYLVEKGELREVTAPGSCMGQHRVFVEKEHSA